MLMLVCSGCAYGGGRGGQQQQQQGGYPGEGGESVATGGGGGDLTVVGGVVGASPTSLVCELCREREASQAAERIAEQKGVGNQQVGEGKAQGASQASCKKQQQQQQQQGQPSQPKLRILCLHGFRQTASGFEVRIWCIC